MNGAESVVAFLAVTDRPVMPNVTWWDASILSPISSAWLGENGFWLATMLVLILVSAFFSGSEAALFSLRNHDISRLAKAGTPGRRVERLLESPEGLLSGILFWNLLINMTYFAIAAILGGRFESQGDYGSTLAVAFTFGSLLTIIFFSEMLPKSIAVLAPLKVSLALASPLTVAMRIVGPILPIVRAANVAARRLIWPGFQPEPELDLADIERAIALGTDDAALLQREQNALRGLVSMAEVRADELMRPRGRLTIHASLQEPSAVLRDGMPEGGFAFVASPTDDAIVGAVHLRLLRPNRFEALEDCVEPVIYVPWSAAVSQVYDELHRQQRRVAIVVNEFGESIGAITVDDVHRSVLTFGQSGDDGHESFERQDDGTILTAGATSLRAVTRFLGIEEPEERAATVAGFIQRRTERLPRVGDMAELGDFNLVIVDETDTSLQIAIRTRRVETDPPAEQAE